MAMNRAASMNSMEASPPSPKVATVAKDIEAQTPSEDSTSWKEDVSEEKSRRRCPPQGPCETKVALAILGYAAFVLWAFSDAMLSDQKKVKYILMDPITQLWADLGAPLARALENTPITPDEISFFHLFIAFISCFFIASTNWNYRRFGMLLYVCRNILDSTDGALARLRASHSGHTLSHDHIMDLDFITDSSAAIMYGVAVCVYFKRANITHPRGYLFFFGLGVLTVFLKGFVMDYFMETYEALGLTPSRFSAFLWKISSYDAWDNLKLFALLSMTEYPFYEFTGYAGFVWVGVPALVSFTEIYGLL